MSRPNLNPNKPVRRREDAPSGLVERHPRHWRGDNVMTNTVGDGGGNGIVPVPAAD
ncbi:hypothetical protein ACIGXM_15260 [Kitasatospora sp. NPDC052896]|uniref:hypothetical protein n=1 Tax=Kitasatospora sp. NPDC052896 TaxID=3364061 RepID=UPI0037CB98E8